MTDERLAEIEKRAQALSSYWWAREQKSAIRQLAAEDVPYLLDLILCSPHWRLKAEHTTALEQVRLAREALEPIPAFVEKFLGYCCGACVGCPAAFHPDCACDCGCHEVARFASRWLERHRSALASLSPEEGGTL